MTTSERALPAIDPFAPASRVYSDGVVVVRRSPRGPALVGGFGADGRLRVRWRMDDSALHDDLAEPLARWLTALGCTDPDVFERALTGIVLTARPTALESWAMYYRNTLERALDPDATGYPEVYREALRLVRGPEVLDVGCGMGFLSLLLAVRGCRVTACDLDEGTVRLLEAMSVRLGRPLRVERQDGRELPLADRSTDTAVLLHMIEHLPAGDADRTIAEAQRVARRRVVIAVPYEDEPSMLFGHVRTIDHDGLAELGARSGWSHEVHCRQGGWLVLDRP